VNRFSLTHLSNEVLCRELSTKAAREKEASTELLAHIAEFDERKLYPPAAYESMLAYCVGELGLSRDEAKQRIHIARAGRACPGVFEALEEGRIHLTGLRLLAPHLTPDNAGDLLSAAAHKSKEDIERLLAARAPRADVPSTVAPVAGGAPEHLGNVVSQGVTGALVVQAQSNSRVSPLSAESYSVQFTRSREADERFRYAQDLLGNRVRSSDLAEVYGRAIEALIEKLEKSRFGACASPHKNASRSRSGSRYVANDVKRLVWKRDQGQCTYVSASGRRCEARRDLQFDHEMEFARGGEATVDNIRLRCPGHNQHTAEKTYGAGFMKRKREEAAAARMAAKAAKERVRAEKAAARAERARIREERERESRLLPHEEEVLPWVCALGIRESEARIAAKRCREMAGARLEDRVKRALTFFGDRVSRKVAPVSRANA